MPDEYQVADHFVGKTEAVKSLYAHLLAAIREFGPVIEAAKKTSIHLDRRVGFAGVYVRKNYLNLNIRTDYPVSNPRVYKTDQVSKNRYHHMVKLETEADLDAELLGWLQDAYALSG